jgi:hypothetical protein
MNRNLKKTEFPRTKSKTTLPHHDNNELNITLTLLSKIFKEGKNKQIKGKESAVVDD